MDDLKIQKVCRVCLSSKGKMHFLFNSDQKQLAETLTFCTQIQVI